MLSFQKINPIATGGAVSLTFTTASTGAISLSRAVSGSTTYTPLYSGLPLTSTGTSQFYLDYGDNGLLDPAVAYVYKLTDTNGTLLSDPVTPAGQFEVNSQPLTEMVMNLMQRGLNNIATPPGIATPTVSFSMPLGGLPPMPFIVIFPTMMKQIAQNLGSDVELPDEENVWTLNELAQNMIQVTVLTKSAPEMLFYRDAVIGIFNVICSEVLADIGNDVEDQWIASSSQQTADFQNLSPGFFQVDVLCEFTGTFNVTITRQYGLIQHIDAKEYDPDGNLLEEEILP